MAGTSKQSTRKINQMNRELTAKERKLAELQAKYRIETNNRERALSFVAQIFSGTGASFEDVMEQVGKYKSFLVNQEMLDELEKEQKSEEFKNELKLS